MKTLLLFATVVTLSLIHKCSGEITSDIKKCPVGDVKCIADTINDLLRKNPNGHKGLGLRNLEPVHLDNLTVAKAHPNSPINLNFQFNDLDVYGLSKTNVTRIVGFERDPLKSKFEVYAVVPLLTLRGQYEANGKVLLLPVVGKGTAEIHLKNFKCGVKVKVAVAKENGKMRVSIDKLKVQIDPESMRVKLDNLFNGNKALGDELNNVANENWREIWSELGNGINDGFTQVVKFLITEVLNTIYYDDFYSD